MDLEEISNRILKEMTVDETMVIAFESMISVSDKLNLKRVLGEEPKLSVCLKFYTKDQLFYLAELNGVKVQKSWKKSKMVDAIESAIIETLDERLSLLNNRQFELLQKLFNAQIVHGSKDQFEFFITTSPILTYLGLYYSKVFIGEDIAVASALPFELGQLLEKRTPSNKVKKDTLTKMKKLETVMNAGVHLYGVVDKERVQELWGILFPKLSLNETFLDRYLPILAIKKNYYFVHTDTFLIGHSILMGPEDVEETYAIKKLKMGNKFYEPSKKEVEYYSKHQFDRRSLHYRRLKQLIYKNSPDPEIVMDALEIHMKVDNKLSEVMDELAEEELIYFESEKDVEKFADTYMNLNNTTRKWMNEGYTPIELRTIDGAVGSNWEQPFIPFADDKSTNNIIPFDSNER